MQERSPIGIFDSGYGGLTVLKDIKALLPDYDYLYLGDNARAPYGNRSFDTVYEYTLQCVQWFFKQGCELVILACNTASAKALRTIQQKYLPEIDPQKRVLGVIRPTSEVIGNYSPKRNIGILGTKGTILSGSYTIEIEKFFPEVKLYQHSCPMWVPLIENNEYESEGAQYFIEKDIKELLSQSAEIDCILLACTHYPLLINEIKKFIPSSIQLISQGEIVAKALKDYLIRNKEMEAKISKGKTIKFYTTDSVSEFNSQSLKFYGESVSANHALIT